MSSLEKRQVHLLGFVILICSGLGCATTNQHAAQGKSVPTWSGQFRAPTSENKSFGVDSRAREIERNLGVD